MTGYGDPDILESWALHYGVISPTQWLTSIFAHTGIVHLIGNLFFLWAFGIVVEGKLGFRGMLQIYLGVGMGECAIEQVLMLGADGGSLGASAAIMGLMAICFVWAPKNEFCTMVIFIRIWIVDIPIYLYCLLCVIEETGFGIDSGQHARRSRNAFGGVRRTISG